MSEIKGEALMDGIVRDIARAKALGLIPEGDVQISARGQFKIEQSNIERAEDDLARRKKWQPFPRHMHGWKGDEVPAGLSIVHETDEGRVEIFVAGKDEETAAAALGWQNEPLSGPRVWDAATGSNEPAEEAAPAKKKPGRKPKNAPAEE